MAKIRSFTFRTAKGDAHPTEVDATWSVVGSGPQALVQISTYGSDARQSQPKVSQTIQVDAAIAAEIVNVLMDTPAPLSPDLGDDGGVPEHLSV